jgi:hypothetical protein
MAHGGPMAPPPGGRGWGPPPPPPPTGAHFRLDIGDDRIDVKCADNEPMGLCADIVLHLVDRILGPGEPPPHPPGGPDGMKQPPPPDAPKPAQ